MPACEPTDEKLRRKNYKAIGLGTKVALFVVRPPPARVIGYIKHRPPVDSGIQASESMEVGMETSAAIYVHRSADLGAN